MRNRVVGLRLLCFLLLVLISAWQGVAGAHGMNLLGAISLHQGELTVRVMDSYQAIVPATTVTATIGPRGTGSAEKISLREASPGTYSGIIRSTPADGDEIIVSTVLADELYRSYVTVGSDADFDEKVVPMVPMEEQHFPWSMVLYVVLAIAVATATAVALLRSRRRNDAEEED